MSAFEQGEFAGFEVPDASFIWCPNQFIDICLVKHSRGVVRLVAYVLYETLKWINENGEPNLDRVSVPYSSLIRDANISRGAIAPALKDAVDANFVEIITKGQLCSSSKCGVATELRLKWSTGDTYTKDPNLFDGFFARQGNRTQIPHSFFTWVVPSESQCVTKVVGTVLRHTVGWETQFGTRVKQTQLSRDFIRRYANIGSDATAEKGIRDAIAHNYLICIEKGSFAEKRPAVFAPKWLTKAKRVESGSKNVANGPFKNCSQNGSNPVAKERFKKCSDINNPEIKTKQQHKCQNAVAVNMLCDFGFDQHSAEQIAANNSHSIIKQQLEWMPLRPSHNNKLGFARRAIEQNWSKPAGSIEKSRESKWQPGQIEFEYRQKAIRQKRRAALLAPWSNATDAERRRWQKRAIEETNDPVLKQCLSGTISEFNPPKHFLDQMAIELGLQQIEQAASTAET